jgi:ferredoxin
VAKTIKLQPIGEEASVRTNDNLLSGLLKNNLQVMQECGGRGMCATCHVFIKAGDESLSPMTRREQRTLEVITTCSTNSRLSCQARVLGEGVIVEIPSGMYLKKTDNIEDLIGTRAEDFILHPINGTVLVEPGKLITRSVVNQLKEVQDSVTQLLAQDNDF